MKQDLTLEKQEDTDLLVIFDLDKTSIYCPIAEFMDRFIPKNMFLKKLYYKLYPFVHILEIKLGLCKVNNNMYLRAKNYINLYNVYPTVVTARHRSVPTIKHVKLIFKDLFEDVYIVCVAQGITGFTKAEYLKKVYQVDDDCEILMFDDSINELLNMRKEFKNCSCYRVKFDGKKEICERC